ncbi:HAMP domain-containing protein, partial [Roseateles sp. P5_E11]
MKPHAYDHRWRERWERKRAKRARRMNRDWEYRWRVRHRWHQRWHHQHKRFKHSLGARLIAIFILLACISSTILWMSMGSAYSLLWAVPALFVVTGLAFGMIRHMVWPLHALAIGAEAFRRGEFSHRVPVIHSD